MSSVNEPGAENAAAAEAISGAHATEALRVAVATERMSASLKLRVEELLRQGADPYVVKTRPVWHASAYFAALERIAHTKSGDGGWLDVFESFARICPQSAPDRIDRMRRPGFTHVDWRSPTAWTHARITESMARHLDPASPAVRGLVERVAWDMTCGIEQHATWSRCPPGIADIMLMTSRLVDSAQFRRFWLEPSTWQLGSGLSRPIASAALERAAVPAVALPWAELSVSREGAPNLLRWLAAYVPPWNMGGYIEAGVRRTFARLVTRLVEEGVDLHAPHSCGLEHWSPLHVATALGAPDTVEALLGADIDPDIRGPGGLTPQAIAGHPADLAPIFAKVRAERARRMLRHGVVPPAASRFGLEAS